MTNITSPSGHTTQGWTGSPNGRGTSDIITSCLVTIILCCWTSVCPNAPALSDGKLDRFRDQFDLACLGLLGPDFLLALAVGQRSSARHSVKKFHRKKYDKWTLTHAFYADMGGFVLRSPDLERPIALTAEQLFYLIESGYVDYPKIDKEEIDDKDKIDGLARLLTLGQALWFVANCIARPLQGLSLTTLELTTLSFVIVLFATSYCWMHKPSGVTRPTILDSKCSVAQIRVEGGCQPDSRYYRTPLDFVAPHEYTLNVIWNYYLNILRHMKIPLFSRPVKQIPHDRIPGDTFMAADFDFEVFLGFFVLCFSSTFITAWNFYFPTTVEQNIWRWASIYILVFGFWGSLLVFIWEHALIGRKRAAWSSKVEEIPLVDQQQRRKTWRGRLKTFADRLRNNTPDGDPSFTIPLGLLIPCTITCALYTLCRG